MRTNLSHVMKALLAGILDPCVFQGSDYSNTNQVTFFTSIFPLYFLNSSENQQILKTGKSNSSRISNLFTRQMSPKRRESRFRERFLNDFDEQFLEEMLLSCRYLLRNYNREPFEEWINEVLLSDVDLCMDENMFFYNSISSHYKNKPSLALVLILLWAFHVDDFRLLINVIEKHPVLSSGTNKDNSGENDPLEPIKKFVDTYGLLPTDVYDFLEIAYNYGISSELGAIAIKTYVDSHMHNNPLITAELADMYLFGTNFKKSFPDKAMHLYMLNANMNYGSGLWSVAQISSNEKYEIDQTPVQMSLKYYERAIQSNHTLSYNNIGKFWIYALHYHLDKVVGIPDYRNIYVNHGRQAISDIYQVMMYKTDFISFLEKFGFSKPVEFITLTSNEKEQLLSQIEDAEFFISDKFIMQAYYKQKYFYSLGTCVTLFEYQLERRNNFSQTYQMKRNYERENTSRQKYEYFVKEYVKYQAYDSQYAYAHYLKNINAEDQDIYEYLYKAVYETPKNRLNHEALLELLVYHVNPRVVYKKKQIDFEQSLFEAIQNYRPNYQSKSRHMYKAVELMLIGLSITFMTKEKHLQILELLNSESEAHLNNREDYKFLANKFIEKYLEPN